MEEILFQSEESFDMMDFSLSHKVLLIRGTIVTGKAGKYISHENIDLLFGGTDFIQIPTSFERGILIKKGDKDKIINTQVVLKAGEYFEIINNNNSYFIRAAVFEILKNNLNTAESSIDGKKYRDTKEYVRKEDIEKYPYLWWFYRNATILNCKFIVFFLAILIQFFYFDINSKEKTKYFFFKRIGNYYENIIILRNIK
ncbi:hypothetical protein [Emticicia sp. 17c]|uniref:hypothetical protein n=1 Tax=Emticicia sp. 17c TaxID=3127704 RepID=UPI00301C6901